MFGEIVDGREVGGTKKGNKFKRYKWIVADRHRNVECRFRKMEEAERINRAKGQEPEEDPWQLKGSDFQKYYLFSVDSPRSVA